MQHMPPTRTDLELAKTQTIPDILQKNLQVVFCGINPGLYTTASQTHFGRPGNRFWKTLFLSGFTPRLLHPSEQNQLIDFGIGITNFAARTSAKASEISTAEFIAGKKILTEKILYYEPKWLVVLAIAAYRTGFAEPKAKVGRQQRTIGKTGVWLLPNPSGLNANYSQQDLTTLFSECREAIVTIPSPLRRRYE